ncbi:MAG: hypothetical protein FE835_07870, partial [Gammaproteobacteria bacterium]|nr:hypothetical protein [Gammaproteobacteria bacterium]
MSGKSKTDSRSVTAAERRLSALQMRKEGRTYREIGKGLGITGTAAYGLVRRAVDSMLKKSFEEAEMIVALENERLDGYLFALNDKIQKGSTQAIGQALKIMERRARLLGLDKPSKIAPTDPEGNEPYEPNGTYFSFLGCPFILTSSLAACLCL